MLRVTAIVLLLVMGAAVQPYPASALNPLDKASVDNSRLVNAFGNPVGIKISVNQQVQIMSDVRNNQNDIQQFIYIVQIKDSAQRIVSLGWIAGSLNSNQVFSPALGWSPQMVGEYTVEIFVWDSFKRQLPLAESSAIAITVS